MSFSSVTALTYPQAYQLMEKLKAVFHENHRADETAKINQVLRQLRYGR